MATLTIKRVKSSETRTEEFIPMNWLKENRNWIIEQILEHNKREDLVAVMTALKNAVMTCTSEHQALGVLDNVKFTAVSRRAELNEFFVQQRESLKRTVFH